MNYAKAYSHPDPYTYADPCAETTEEIAEAIVDAYTDEEITNLLPAWLAVVDKCDVHDAWWTEVHHTMTDEEMDATFERIWADGTIDKFVLPQLLKGDGALWKRFKQYFTGIEAGLLDNPETGYDYD